MGSIRRIFPALFAFFILFPLYAQNTQTPPSSAALAAEISRLEKLTLGPAGSAQAGAALKERYNAFLNLVRLHRLSGNSEAALKTCADALAVFPGEGRLLLEQGRLLLSQGEYEKAGEVIKVFLRSGLDNELVLQGRYLDAQIIAFRSGDTQALALLADDPDFAEYHSGICYTLWKLTGLSSWKTRLTAEFPRSPEAKIAASAAGVDSAPTPLWLLFPGRESITLAPAASSPETQVPPAVPAAQPASGQSQDSVLLQCGLFGREDNAKAMSESLKKAGFQPQVSMRNVNGNDRWAVTVPGGKDMNATIKLLKDAGFESFPVR